MNAIEIRRATLDDVDLLAPLFDSYRQFYEQDPDPAAAREFLCARLRQDESVIFLATNHGEPAGLTQLYPTFTSVGVSRIWKLNDLYVDARHRRGGVARALMDISIDFARRDGGTRLDLETADDNVQAQPLYEDLGFVQQRGIRMYALKL